ncbi:MAG: transporter [Gammaproteobacteria bacterium]|nr:transporter [Gammaproteobacteria bacterium]
MEKSVFVIALAAVSTQAMSAAYKIPEQSINSTALSGAYIANANGADASYYNPAAMVFNKEGATIEADLTYIHLTGIEIKNDSPGFANDETKEENFLVPTFHYVSPLVGNARFGLSLIAPAGLTKRWKGDNRAFAEDFTLKTIEINPTAGYKFNDRFSIGGGLRAVYSQGKVKSSNTAHPLVTVGRDMDGESWDFGYNLALQFRATDALDLALTYRSKIDLTVDGDATLFGSVPPGLPGAGFPLPVYNDGARVTVPLPAALNLAAAYTFNDRTTVELVYERTYWSAYKKLDFKYDRDLNPVFTAVFDDPIKKKWQDSNSFRIGITHRLDGKWTLMGGFAYDKTPIKEKYIGFELPDSDAKIFSLGARYQYSDKLNLGAAFLYDKKDSLKLKAGENINAALAAGAKFEDASAYLLTVGMNYDF